VAERALRITHSIRMRIASCLGLVCLLCSSPPPCPAQELEPRAYSLSPIGTQFLVIGGGRSSGGVLFDPSLPYRDVQAKLDTALVGYGYTFALFDHFASATVVAPYVWGNVSGNVGEDRHEVQRAGSADAKLRLSVNLLGGPALTPREFARRTPQTTLGASLSISAPTGQYDSTRLVNIGANRWAFKPELGISHPSGPWDLEAYVGMWFFTPNHDFRGVTRSQDPIATVQAHVSYTVRPRLWLAIDATYYSGGNTTVNHTRNADAQQNARAGVTLSIPLATSQSLKLSWSAGATTRVGSDFTLYGIAWQRVWLDR
jgi:hypothetical protein